MAVQTISPGQLKDLLSDQPDLPLIDVRLPAEFREVHVTGAKNVPLDRLSADMLANVSRAGADSPLYFICKGGVRSLKACEKAQKLGVENTISVDGGTEQCVAEGLPIEKGEKAFAIERQVRIVAGAMIATSGVLAITVHPYWAGLAAFCGTGLMVAGITNSCAMGMLLMKMPWNQR